MVAPMLAAAGIGALAGGGMAGLGMLGSTGTGQAGKMYERQANLAKKTLNLGFNQLNKGNVQGAYRSALDRGSQFPSTVAPFSPETMQSFGMMQQQAQQPTGADELRQMGMSTLRGDYMHPGSNPYLSGAIESATRPTLERLGEVALPGVHSAAIAGGAYGGNRPDLVNQAITRDSTREALDIANRMAFENYGQERNRQFEAGNLLTQASGLGLLPAQYMAGIGAAKEAKTGQQLGEGRERYEAETNAIRGRPLAGLNEMMAFASGAPNPQVTNISPSTGQQISGVMQGALGGAMTGASMSPMLQQLLQQVRAPQPSGNTGYGGAGFSYPYYGGPR